jgi:hypothetical protein
VKTQDWIQLGALGLVGYLAYKKWAVPGASKSNAPPAHPMASPPLQSIGVDIPDLSSSVPSAVDPSVSFTNPSTSGQDWILDVLGMGA